MKHRYQKPKVLTKRRFIFANRRNPSFIDLLKKYFTISLLLLVAFVIYPRDFSLEKFTPSTNLLPNLGITEIQVEGLDRLDKEGVLKAAAVTYGQNILSLSPAEVKQRIEGLSWIAKAIVHRELPDKIVIHVEEEKPRAIFIKNNSSYYINYSGDIIDTVQDHSVTQSYIYVTGENSNTGFSDILDQIYISEAIYNQLDGLIKVDDRRWDVVLKSKLLIKLPEKDVSGALKSLDNILKDIDFTSVCSMVDLRFMPNKIYIKF